MRPYGISKIQHQQKASHIRMGLIIRSSEIHAAGCYTTAAIRKGARVAEYTGHKLSKEKADQTFEDSPITYLFGLGDGEIVIDGHSMAMFINHSCDPNCETEEKDGHVWIKAIRNIAPAEEITYDYCLYDGGEDDAICNCGAPKCRGTMYSREEIRRRKAAAKKAALRARKNGATKKRRLSSV
jgi:SET domain-containing protein